MTKSLILQDFSAPTPPVETVAAPPMAVDASQGEDALAAFDRGYKSGWDDSAQAEAEERRAVGAALAKNLQEATLNYEAARRGVLGALGPLFDEIVGTLLPRMAAEAVAPSVLSELSDLAATHLNAEIELIAAPSACASLERLIESQGITDLTVRAEPAFAEGQVSLRAAQERRDIDIGAAADRIAEAISAYQTQITPTSDLTQGAA